MQMTLKIHETSHKIWSYGQLNQNKWWREIWTFADRLNYLYIYLTICTYV